MTSPSKKYPENHFPMRLGQKYCPQENFSRPQADPKSSRRIRLPKTSSKKTLLPQANSWIKIRPKQNCTIFWGSKAGVCNCLQEIPKFNSELALNGILSQQGWNISLSHKRYFIARARMRVRQKGINQCQLVSQENCSLGVNMSRVSAYYDPLPQ